MQALSLAFAAEVGAVDGGEVLPEGGLACEQEAVGEGRLSEGFNVGAGAALGRNQQERNRGKREENSVRIEQWKGDREGI